MSSIHDLHHHFKQKERHIMKERDNNISGFLVYVFLLLYIWLDFEVVSRENTDTHEGYALIVFIDIRE